MAKAPKDILIITPTFAPDVGGVETHLTDLVGEVGKHRGVTVLSYQPIVTAGVGPAPGVERHPNLTIHRYRWFGGNLFRKLEKTPLLLFLYITPYLGLRAFLYLVRHSRQVAVLHVHGLNTAFVGMVLGFLFRKPVLMQTHALYSFNPRSAFGRAAGFVLGRLPRIITLCEASRREILSLGVPPRAVGPYRYWLDLEAFRPRPRPALRKKLGFKRVTLFFVARLMAIKGTAVVAHLAARFPKVDFVVAGDGPDRGELEASAAKQKNLRLIGLIDNKALAPYYGAADLVLVPSQYPEGFGRVICESLACGTPVLASRLGGIPDAMDETVGVLCGPTAAEFEKALKALLAKPAILAGFRRRARPYAEKHFSTANARAMLGAYRDLER